MANKISPKKLYEAFVENGVSYFCGVPDSLLSSFGFYLEDHAKDSHDIAVNEGSAVALGIGRYLSTSKVPLVYMQNSGLGNAINPLVSLADPLIMGIPMILLIGWRGQPDKEDEPQHQKQGLITQPLLDSMGIAHTILSRSSKKLVTQIKNAVREALNSKHPYAILVEGDVLEPYKHATTTKTSNYELSREEAIELIISSLSGAEIVVATTGKIGRELFELRRQKHQRHNDLLVVGGMGHASSIAFGIAQQKSDRKVFCIDGDGAVLMHMGSLATIGTKKLKNFHHIVINNGTHESVGGQSTVGFAVNMPEIAKASGYVHTYSVTDSSSLKNILQTLRGLEGPVFIEVRVNTNSRANLTRPTIHPSKNKKNFMSFLDEI